MASDELLDVRGQSGYPAGVRIILLVGLVIATALCASGCGESRYGGLSRDAARAKADEMRQCSGMSPDPSGKLLRP